MSSMCTHFKRTFTSNKTDTKQMSQRSRVEQVVLV